MWNSKQAKLNVDGLKDVKVRKGPHAASINSQNRNKVCDCERSKKIIVKGNDGRKMH